jgi:nitrile hydratase subunit beta
MNGAHDMGGVMGFGPVVAEKNEPVFHFEWEARVRAMTMAMVAPMGSNIDQGRFAREDRSPSDYLSKTYYELWFAGLIRMLLDRGLVVAEELTAARSMHPAKQVPRILRAEDVASVLAKGRPYGRMIQQVARFKSGDRVRARNMHPTGHTRLPRYVRGHIGTVMDVHGAHVFPDSNAAGLGEAPQWLYNVRFAGRELWGEAADPTLTVSVDAWETYLEPIL